MREIFQSSPFAENLGHFGKHLIWKTTKERFRREKFLRIFLDIYKVEFSMKN